MPPLIGTPAFTAYRAEAARLAAYRLRLGPQARAEETENEMSEAVSLAVSEAASESGLSQAASAMSTDSEEEIEGELSARSSDADTDTDSDALTASSDADLSDGSQNDLDDLATKQLSWQFCSKHSLLRFLRKQIQHINDVAALMYYWTECNLGNWDSQLNALGLSAPYYDSWAAGCGVRCRLSNLKAAIYEAFLLGWDGFVDFHHDKDDAANKWREFKVFSSDDVQQDLMKNKNELVFLCVLYQLQQLPADVVLARLHSMLSRCCRCDLLVLSEVLEQEVQSQIALNEYDAEWVEEPESEIVMAFAQIEPTVAYALYQLTPEQECSMVMCVKGMVDSYVSRSKWSGPLEFLCRGS